MKICILKESLSIGGTERSAANISAALAERHEVNMVLYDGSDIQYEYGGKLFDLKAPASKHLIVKVINNIRRIVRFRRYVRQEKPDVIFQFVSYRHPLGRMRFENCVKLISARDFAMLEQHAETVKMNLDASDGLICNSECLRDFYLAKYPEDKDKVFTVPNIIDAEKITAQAAEKIDDSRFEAFCSAHANIVVSTGRFCKVKAFERLISVIKACRDKCIDVGLVLVGDGDFREKYLAQIAELGLEGHVFLTGYQKNPYNYMRRGDIFVLPSLNEGFPNVLAEAMTLGIPVISTNCYSGPAEILTDSGDYYCASDSFVLGEYGILVPRDERIVVDEIAKAVEYLLVNDDERQRFKTLAMHRAACYSAEAAVERFEKIFTELGIAKQPWEHCR